VLFIRSLGISKILRRRSALFKQDTNNDIYMFRKLFMEEELSIRRVILRFLFTVRN